MVVRFLVFFLLATPNVYAYDYPYTNRWLASVSMGLLKVQKDGSFWDHDVILQKTTGEMSSTPLRFRFYPAHHSKDLVIVLPGLGGRIKDGLANFYAKDLARAGHDVLIVPGHFTPQFALGMSRSAFVGVTDVDAADMRSALQQILQTLHQEYDVDVHKTKLLGYSLGALLATFVAQQEQQNPTLNITQTVLINPPVGLLHGIDVLDQLGRLGGLLDVDNQIRLTLGELNIGLNLWMGNENDPSYFMNMDSYMNVSNYDLEYLIGQKFKGSLQNIFKVVAQKYVDTNQPLPPLQGFRDYLERVIMNQMFPAREHPSVDAFAESESIVHLKDFLGSSKDIFLFHNADDFLLTPQDPDFLQNLMGNRMILYPHGGHCGNAWYSENRADLVRVME